MSAFQWKFPRGLCILENTGGGREAMEVILLSLFANVGNSKNMPTAKKKCIVQYLNAYYLNILQGFRWQNRWTFS